ncbi:MAG: transposase [Gemmatimonadota bacterium]
MRCYPNGHPIPNRRSIRHKRHDYSTPGAYFITFNTWRWRRILSTIVRSRVELTPLGRIVERNWLEIPQYFDGVVVDAFVIMPDHVHGIIHLPGPPCRPIPLSGVVRHFKLSATKWARDNLAMERIWHRNYHERIVRDQRALETIRRYIIANPAKWRGVRRR